MFIPLAVLVEFLEIIIPVVVALIAGVVGFFTAKAQLRKEFQSKYDDLRNKQHKIELGLSELENTDALQQQILDQLKLNVLDRLPEILSGNGNGAKKKGKK